MSDLAKELLAELQSLVEFVEVEFDWADGEPSALCIDGVSMCSSCQSAGCINDKLRRARAAISKATSRQPEGER